MRKKYRNWKKRLCQILAVPIAITFTIFLYSLLVINPLVCRVATAKVSANITMILSRVLIGEIDMIQYADLVQLTLKDDGSVSGMTFNTGNANRIAYRVVQSLQQELNVDKGFILELPLGVFTGLAGLSQYGKAVYISVLPIGVAGSKFKSEFIAAGINQTKHSLSLELTISVNLVLPLILPSLTVSSSILLSEAIIVGQVPEFFVDSISLGQPYPLVP